MKFLLSFLFLFSAFVAIGQNKILKGKFIGDNLEKSYINVININQYKASISQLDGKFEIDAKVGDSILISSIQYVEVKFIVKPEFFTKSIEIELKLKVNELNQVDLYSMGLSGNLETDAKNIKIKKSLPAEFENFDVSKVYDEEVTTQSEFTLRNVAMEQNPIPASVDLKAVFRLINKALRPKKKKSKLSYNYSENSKKLSDVDFIVNVLEINEDQVGQFVNYVKANGITKDMLKQSKELELIDFLLKTSIEFKAIYGK